MDGLMIRICMFTIYQLVIVGWVWQRFLKDKTQNSKLFEGPYVRQYIEAGSDF